MDYSQFLIMRGEISLLLVFLLIFLFDTFGGKKSLKGLSITACVLFALHTVCYGVRGYVSDFSHSFDG